MACSVITVFGADTPAGNAPSCCMTGFAMQSVAALHLDCDGGPEPGPFPLPDP
jgi:hypothetical protein